MEQMKDLSEGPEDEALLRLDNAAVVGPYDGAAEGVDDGVVVGCTDNHIHK